MNTVAKSEAIGFGNHNALQSSFEAIWTFKVNERKTMNVPNNRCLELLSILGQFF